MNIYDLIVIPIAWGLIGFIEPCSIGINTLFLSHIQYKKDKNLFWEITIFILVRSLTLASLGFLLAWGGKEFFVIERSVFIVLGALYIIMGIIVLLNKRFPLMKNINMQKLVGAHRKSAHLGFMFGLIIPACALPFIFILLGKAIILQSALMAFFSLFVFGLTLSLPLYYFGLSKRGLQALTWIGKKVKNVPYLVGAVFILIGILTAWSNVWWK